MEPTLHEALEPFAFLLGTWRGEGKGSYPTMTPFDYVEEMVFEHVGDPFLMYRQSSWSPGEAAPLHFERGFLRPGAHAASVELTLAHPLGLVEVSEGALDGTTLTFTSRSIGRTRTGSAVTELVRTYRVDGLDLEYEVDMAMDETPMSRHLTAHLRKIDT
jgi:hypothetical protein